MAEAELATVARPYARAAFATALEEADGLVSWSRMLALLGAAVVEPAVERMLDNPANSGLVAAQWLTDLMGDDLTASGANFVKVLADFDRLALIATIGEQNLGPEQARGLSSPFLPGYRFKYQTPEQLARHFGAAFVVNLEQTKPSAGQWVGPVRSTYGLHYVYVGELEPSRDATLDEVRAVLVRDIDSRARSTALLKSTQRMREDYEMML